MGDDEIKYECCRSTVSAFFISRKICIGYSRLRDQGLRSCEIIAGYGKFSLN